jgi:hypothetical protein
VWEVCTRPGRRTRPNSSGQGWACVAILARTCKPGSRGGRSGEWAKAQNRRMDAWAHGQMGRQWRIEIGNFYRDPFLSLSVCVARRLTAWPTTWPPRWMPAVSHFGCSLAHCRRFRLGQRPARRLLFSDGVFLWLGDSFVCRCLLGLWRYSGLYFFFLASCEWSSAGLRTGSLKVPQVPRSHPQPSCWRLFIILA